MLTVLALIVLARANGFVIPLACWVILVMTIIGTAFRFFFYSVLLDVLKKVIR